MNIPEREPNDSFSYRWLIHVKSSIDESISDSHQSIDTESSFIEMDPHCISLRWKNDHDDKIFSDDPPTSEAACLSSGVVDKAQLQASSISLLSSSLNTGAALLYGETYIRKNEASKNAKLKSPVSFRHCLGHMKRMLWRYLSSKLILLKKPVKSWANHAGSSQRRTINLNLNREWCHSSADISIHDAILHCKRSNEQQDK